MESINDSYFDLLTYLLLSPPAHALSASHGITTAGMASEGLWPTARHGIPIHPRFRFRDLTTTESVDLTEGAKGGKNIFPNLTILSAGSRSAFHSLYHPTPDIRYKGPHFIYCARANEGLHQETREIYARLNKRDGDKQGCKFQAQNWRLQFLTLNPLDVGTGCNPGGDGLYSDDS
ncbi:hypothetical protein B0H13DRAFT_1874236 [Mycena leptocephala]|nr:hypothetical protein B0H13DRAFT_1874236 [Mycena leptocephala]